MPPIGRPGSFDKGSAQRIAQQLRLSERNAVNGSTDRQRRAFSGQLKGQLIAVLDEDLLYGEDATASVWLPNIVTGVEADSGRNVTVRAWLLEDGKKLEGGSRVHIEKISGRWYVVNARECAVDQ